VGGYFLGWFSVPLLPDQSRHGADKSHVIASIIHSARSECAWGHALAAAGGKKGLSDPRHYANRFAAGIKHLSPKGRRLVEQACLQGLKGSRGSH
jgi:hypothetical protein